MTMAKLTTEDFIRKAKEVHGEKYDYSKVEYVNPKTKVIIICPEHGEFLQHYHHLCGVGCPKCSGRGKSTTDIINEFINVHGNKYDYSKVKYVGNKTKLIIVCSKHGEFLQNAHNHLSGKGCPKCAGRGLTNEDFIKEAKSIHGDKYDYSKAGYINNTTKVTIICSIHGEFELEPTVHINTGRGCPKCSGRYMDTEYFKEKAKSIHGDKYDYSKVTYRKNYEKVTIICPVHGEFQQIANCHLNGNGCPKCNYTNIGDSKRMTQEEYIQRVIEIHGNKFDYSKANYVSMHEKITIVCSTHGEFKQEASAHLFGKQGCPKCGGRYLDLKYFIEKATAIHDNRYDYSKVNYVSSQSKVTIICPVHGEFQQKPSGHLNGNGCPKCLGRGFDYKSLDEVKKIIQSVGIKNRDEYIAWWNTNKKYCQENGIPQRPERAYNK